MTTCYAIPCHTFIQWLALQEGKASRKQAVKHQRASRINEKKRLCKVVFLTQSERVYTSSHIFCIPTKVDIDQFSAAVMAKPRQIPILPSPLPLRAFVPKTQLKLSKGRNHSTGIVQKTQLKLSKGRNHSTGHCPKDAAEAEQRSQSLYGAFVQKTQLKLSKGHNHKFEA